VHCTSSSSYQKTPYFGPSLPNPHRPTVSSGGILQTSQWNTAGAAAKASFLGTTGGDVSVRRPFFSCL